MKILAVLNGRILIFVKTKIICNRIEKDLKDKNFVCFSIHGDKK